MELDKSLEIDPEHVQSKIISYMQSILKGRAINGLVVLYRDCIESLINTKLAELTVGTENIKLVVTRGRFSSSEPTGSKDLEIIDKYLKIPENNIVFTNLEEAVHAINNLSFDKTEKQYNFIKAYVTKAHVIDAGTSHIILLK